MTLTANELIVLRGYAAGRRPNLKATELGALHRKLARAGLVRNRKPSERTPDNPLLVGLTDRGRAILAAAEQPVQLELFAAGGAR
jgi:hypothetical protein